MPKRRRLMPSPLKKNKQLNFPLLEDNNELPDKFHSTPRSRLRGALQDALEPPNADESDTSTENIPSKRERAARSSSEDEKLQTRSPPRQSYVLKLFDRSVDLSQFKDDSPLYPICRAWIANQPKANYKSFRSRSPEPSPCKGSVSLPPPTGPPVSKIPELLPEQQQRSKDNINLDYRSAPPPAIESLLLGHMNRWLGVRAAWSQRAMLLEQRYADTQDVLNKINVNVM